MYLIEPPPFSPCLGAPMSLPSMGRRYCIPPQAEGPLPTEVPSPLCFGSNGGPPRISTPAPTHRMVTILSPYVSTGRYIPLLSSTSYKPPLTSSPRTGTVGIPCPPSMPCQSAGRLSQRGLPSVQIPYLINTIILPKLIYPLNICEEPTQRLGPWP